MRALKITSTITRRDEQSIEKYFTEISKFDVLTPEEEIKLFQDLKNGDEGALAKIVSHNLRFVVSVAKKYQNLGLKLGDLINEGNVGLITAAKRFDETKGFKFISYAVWWIRQSILQAVNEKSRKIRLPLNLKSIGTKVQSTIDEIYQLEERIPTVEELAEATGLTEDVIQNSIANHHRCKSLDAPINDDGDGSLGSLLMDDSLDQPDFELAVLDSQKIEISHLLSMLPERQATIISMYYGINRKHAMTLDSIATHMGLTRERVRQIKDKGIIKLRQKSDNFQPTFSMN